MKVHRRIITFFVFLSNFYKSIEASITDSIIPGEQHLKTKENERYVPLVDEKKCELCLLERQKKKEERHETYKKLGKFFCLGHNKDNTTTKSVNIQPEKQDKNVGEDSFNGNALETRTENGNCNSNMKEIGIINIHEEAPNAIRANNVVLNDFKEYMIIGEETIQASNLYPDLTCDIFSPEDYGIIRSSILANHSLVNKDEEDKQSKTLIEENKLDKKFLQESDQVQVLGTDKMHQDTIKEISFKDSGSRPDFLKKSGMNKKINISSCTKSGELRPDSTLSKVYRLNKSAEKVHFLQTKDSNKKTSRMSKEESKKDKDFNSFKSLKSDNFCLAGTLRKKQPPAKKKPFKKLFLSALESKKSSEGNTSVGAIIDSLNLQSPVNDTLISKHIHSGFQIEADHGITSLHERTSLESIGHMGHETNSKCAINDHETATIGSMSAGSMYESSSYLVEGSKNSRTSQEYSSNYTHNRATAVESKSNASQSDLKPQTNILRQSNGSVIDQSENVQMYPSIYINSTEREENRLVTNSATNLFGAIYTDSQNYLNNGNPAKCSISVLPQITNSTTQKFTREKSIGVKLDQETDKISTGTCESQSFLTKQYEKTDPSQQQTVEMNAHDNGCINNHKLSLVSESETESSTGFLTHLGRSFSFSNKVVLDTEKYQQGISIEVKEQGSDGNEKVAKSLNHTSKLNFVLSAKTDLIRDPSDSSRESTLMKKVEKKVKPMKLKQAASLQKTLEKSPFFSKIKRKGNLTKLSVVSQPDAQGYVVDQCFDSIIKNSIHDEVLFGTIATQIIDGVIKANKAYFSTKKKKRPKDPEYNVLIEGPNGVKLEISLELKYWNLSHCKQEFLIKIHEILRNQFSVFNNSLETRSQDSEIKDTNIQEQNETINVLDALQDNPRNVTIETSKSDIVMPSCDEQFGCRNKDRKPITSNGDLAANEMHCSKSVVDESERTKKHSSQDAYIDEGGVIHGNHSLVSTGLPKTPMKPNSRSFLEKCDGKSGHVNQFVNDEKYPSNEQYFSSRNDKKKNPSDARATSTDHEISYTKNQNDFESEKQEFELQYHQRHQLNDTDLRERIKEQKKNMQHSLYRRPADAEYIEEYRRPHNASFKKESIRELQSENFKPIVCRRLPIQENSENLRYDELKMREIYSKYESMILIGFFILCFFVLWVKVCNYVFS